MAGLVPVDPVSPAPENEAAEVGSVCSGTGANNDTVPGGDSDLRVGDVTGSALAPGKEVGGFSPEGVDGDEGGNAL